MRFSDITRPLLVVAIFLGFLALKAPATTYYVDVNSTNPTPPYTSWATASTDIQSAVNETTNGDLVLVNPGVYQSGGYVAPSESLTCVVISNAITLQSVDGPNTTLIDGSNAMTGVYVCDNAIVQGFTITNGYSGWGGGVYCAPNGWVIDCTLINNYAPTVGGDYQGTLSNCLVTGNSAGNIGGLYQATAEDCIISNNSVGAAIGCTFYNSLIVNNSSPYNIGGIFASVANNCTIVGNSSSFVGGAYANCILNNCIVYGNIAPTNAFANCYQCTVNYSCTAPLQSGPGNITNAPLFVNITNDFHLQSNSPCINMGNNAYVTYSNDFDGNPRVVGGFVDMGAYEYQTPVTMTAAIQVDNTNITTGFPLQLQGIIGRGFASVISWDFGDGTTAANSSTVSHSWISPGIYTVTLTVSNDYVPEATSATLIIDVTSQSVFYVNANGTNPTSPYSSWDTAATNIQDAVDVAADGGTVLVTNGIYQYGGETVGGFALTNRIAVNTTIAVQSVNGPAETFIQGYQVPGTTNGSTAVRCVYLCTNATLIGFTLTNGATLKSGDPTNEESGGGVWCPSSNGVIISNCVLQANAAWNQGGGAFQGTLQNCTIVNNEGGAGGGASSALLVNCLIISNVANAFTNIGGGIYNCTVLNSAITGNFAGQGGGAYAATLVNCTIVANFATNCPGTFACNQTNCIIYYNAPSNTNAIVTNWIGGSLNYCCTTPLPKGMGSITNAPLLAGIFDIGTNSPCRGAGNSAVVSGVDINGNPWANPPSIGCEEPYPGNMFGNVSVNILASGTNIPVGYPINFQANISGPVYNSVWNFGDGTTITNVPYLSHTWSAIGNYQVTLTAYNGSYPNGYTDTIMVNVFQPMTFYVNLNSTNPIAPYLSWDTASVDIQDAVNVAVAGSLVLVTNGIPAYQGNGVAIYQFNGANAASFSNRVAVLKPLTLQSVNGPALTWIEGSYFSSRCVYLTNGAVLSGFTLANGYAAGSGSGSEGGGIFAQSTNAFITNCIITGCAAGTVGGAVYSGTLYNCLIKSNFWANTYSGCAYTSVVNSCEFINNRGGNGTAAAFSTLNNCLVSNNSSSVGAVYECVSSNCILIKNSATYGGGAYGGILNNCLLVGNSAASFGGAAAGEISGDGNYPVLLNNCVISNNTAVWGGGVYAQNSSSIGFTNCILTNCLLAFNQATTYGGGAFYAELNSCVISNNNISGTGPSYGGGVEGGLLNNCILTGNFAQIGGGADGFSVGRFQSILNNCILVANISTNGGDGGGADDSILNQCTVLNNTCSSGDGGGVYNSSVYNSLIISNSALGSPYPKGEGGGAYFDSLTNCILAFNFAHTMGGGAFESTLVNCTITTNISGGAGVDSSSTLYNSIVYGNYSTSGSLSNWNVDTFNFCCTYPLPASGHWNITNDPAFVNLAAGNYHLQPNSPCINSGNNAYILSPTDFDGNPRIVGGTVDIGAYEYQTPTSVISYAYLQQYGLPTDGSVDFADLDGTPYNVYQDWIAGLNPTNPASVLLMLSPAATNNTSGITVSWESVSGIDYNLLRTTNLTSAWTTLQSNIVGQAGTTSYADTSATNGGSYFYQVAVP